MRKIFIGSYSGTKFLATIASTLACTAATNTYYAQLDGLVHFESDTDTEDSEPEVEFTDFCEKGAQNKRNQEVDCC